MPRIWDVVVVGAGMTGVLAAERLERAGLRVLLFEAGARLRRGQRAGEVDRRAWAFRAGPSSFDWYRVRAVGGRAHLWGGWCQRFPAHVYTRAGWPVSERELRADLDAVERWLGVRDGRVDARYSRLAKSVGVRIVPKRGAVRDDGSVWTPTDLPTARRARTDHVALHFEADARRATCVVALDLRTGKLRRIRARAFVLAASPIETARILLASDLPARHPAIGRNLVDHMVAGYVLLEPTPPPPPLSPDARGPFPGSALVEGFVNVDAKSQRPYPGGFCIELSGPWPLETLGIERMVPRDEVSRWSATQIHAIGELFPTRTRFVELDGARDVYERRVPKIHFGWAKAENALAKDLRRACLRLADVLAVSGSRVIPLTDPLLPGAGHEAGTCAMGLDDASACDPSGRLRGLENVWIADASVMPTAGDRHPTLTLLAHAARAARATGRYVTRNDSGGRRGTA